ncbi:zinc transporter ZIP13-like [Asterias rubens]|uniref:zinc transporter ZIP13-like n=1 Tax=Asterias rubens TaxID=7604 RepID=UPI0014553395|nr:zinc transporter ZIP13-like [Asterias rubens]
MYNQVERACRDSPAILLLVCVILLLSTPAIADIHRAKTHTGKVSPYPSSQLRSNREKSGTDGVVVGDDSVELEDGSIAIDEGYEAWVFALLATTLVGMTGIFPLLLPIDVGPATTNKEGAAKFKCLLSFAVGGLLGDVFFHLLPEAWSHVSPDDHAGQVSIGLWVIFGVFAFLVLEMMFGDNEAEKQNTENANPQGEKPKTHDPETYPLPNKSASTSAPALGNGHIMPKNNSKSRKRRKTQENGDVRSKESESNGWNASNRHALKHDNNNHNGYMQSVEDHQKVECKESKVKVTGYLNLLANFIDNFTHGLAIAGSFLISKKCGILTTAAILLHEVPHEIGDFAILLRSGFDRWRAAKAQVCTATGGLCGALLALMSESAEKAGDSAAWILPFTSGGFLNIALVTVLPDLLEETNPRETVKQILCLLVGIGIMGAVNLVVD